LTRAREGDTFCVFAYLTLDDGRRRMSDSARRSLAASIAAVTVVLTVSCSQWPWLLRPSYAAAAVLQTGALALLLIAFLPLRGALWPGLRFNAAFVALGAYAVYIVLTSLWATLPGISFAGAATAATGPLWAALLGMLLLKAGHVRAALRGIFYAGALAAAVGLAWSIGTHTFDSVERVMGHRNFLAVFMLPGLVLGGAELVGRVAGRPMEALRLNRWVVAGGMALMIAALGACRSAGAVAGLAVGAGCVACAWLTRQQRIALAVCAALLIALALLWTARAAQTGELMKSHHATRWYMWQGTLKMIAERPLQGWGTGMFAFNFTPFKPVEPMKHGWLTSVTIYPHDELLLVAVEGGLIALALYLMAHGWIAGGCVRGNGGQETGDGGRGTTGGATGWVLVGAAAAMFTHGLVEVALRFWAPAAMYWTLLGVMIAWPRAGEGEPSAAPRAAPFHARWIGFVLAVVIAAGAFWGVVRAGLRSERLLNTADSGAGSAKEQAAEIERGLALSRYSPDWLVGMGRLADAQTQARDIDAVIRTYEEFNEKAHGFGHVRRFLAGAYLRRGAATGARDPEAAKADLGRAIALLESAVAANPWDAAARQPLAMALLTASMRNLPAALEHARVAAESDARSAEARYLHGALLLESGRKAEAAVELAAAARLCPPEDVKFLEKIERARKEADPPI
jgi:O-antigen ligase